MEQGQIIGVAPTVTLAYLMMALHLKYPYTQRAFPHRADRTFWKLQDAFEQHPYMLHTYMDAVQYVVQHVPI